MRAQVQAQTAVLAAQLFSVVVAAVQETVRALAVLLVA
jgi:hypothetical protein